MLHFRVDEKQYENDEHAAMTNYDNQANQLVAKNLKGKLLLAHGTMDA